MRGPFVLSFVLLSVACARDNTAVRPAHDPDNLPQAGADPPAPVASALVTAPAPAASAAPRDPLLEKPVDCGPPRPNPNGVALEWMTTRDGSCLVCESAPAALSPCSATQRATKISTAALESNRGKRVSFEGTLSAGPGMCTKRGGPCACNNKCSSALRLAPSPDEALHVTLSESGEQLRCGGDEGSLCCPYALGEKGTANVVVSGKLVQEPAVEGGSDADRAYQLEVETICSK